MQADLEAVPPPPRSRGTAGEPRPATVGEVVAALDLADSTVTGILDRAEHAGLVTRSPAPHDGRIVEVRVTAEGRERFARAFAALADDRRALARAGVALDAIEGAVGRPAEPRPDES